MDFDAVVFWQQYGFGALALLCVLGVGVNSWWTIKTLNRHLNECSELQREARDDRKDLHTRMNDLANDVAYIKGDIAKRSC